MPKFRLEYLFTLYLQGNITPDEQRELMELIADAGNEDQVMDIIETVANKVPHEKEISGDSSYKILNSILQRTTVKEIGSGKRSFPFWLSIAAAWALIMALLGVWFKTSHIKKNQTTNSSRQLANIRPGGNKALLTFDDGTTINLSEIDSAALAKSNSKILIKKEDGFLVYENVGGKENKSTYNKLTTPRGGQFEVLLPDGSKVWLNAESSIRYPVAFAENERVVELTGEAFFTIKKLYKKNKAGRVPFCVRVQSSAGDIGTVRVLGTAFNVNAYENENMCRVTLKHGVVKIEKGNKTQMLKPGEQAQLYENGSISLAKNADVGEAIAWKNGNFLFENEDIASIMKKISRWYDVEVVYKSVYHAERFDGKISRYADLQEVLEILRLSGIQFTITNKTILVQ